MAPRGSSPHLEATIPFCYAWPEVRRRRTAALRWKGMEGLRMTRLHARHSTLALLAGAAICLGNGAHAAGPSIGLRASDCEIPGIIGWYQGNAISNGMPFNWCPHPIPLPAPATSPPPPAAAATPAPPATEDAQPVAEDASPSPEPSSPVVVVAPPPPPQRIPGAVPTYAPWTATAGPGSNAVGNGNGTGGYSNPYNTLAPSARAVVNKADWCNRNGRSRDVANACNNHVESR